MTRGHLRRLLGRSGSAALPATGGEPELRGQVFVQSAGELQIGRRVVVGGAPAPSHLVTGPGGILRIGDDVVIGHGAAISSQALVDIGDGARFGHFVIVMDSDFHVPGSDAVPTPQPVVIGRGAVIGHRVTIMPGARIGDGARIIAGSVVAGKIPDGVTARGFPARRVKT